MTEFFSSRSHKFFGAMQKLEKVNNDDDRMSDWQEATWEMGKHMWSDSKVSMPILWNDIFCVNEKPKLCEISNIRMNFIFFFQLFQIEFLEQLNLRFPCKFYCTIFHVAIVQFRMDGVMPLVRCSRWAFSMAMNCGLFTIAYPLASSWMTVLCSTGAPKQKKSMPSSIAVPKSLSSTAAKIFFHKSHNSKFMVHNYTQLVLTNIGGSYQWL